MNCGCSKTNTDPCNTETVVCNSGGRLIDNVSTQCIEEDKMITVKGVCSRTKIESLLTTGEKTWTQVFIPEVLCVPPPKPDIERLISVSSCVEIIYQRVVKTPVLKTATGDMAVENHEGTFITGRKLVIEGLLRQKVMYVADVETQSVHTAHFDVPFSSFIILPVKTPLTTRYKTDACIEDIFISKTTSRQIFKNITLFIKATPLVCS